jgi:hypothetical protein
MDPLLRSADLLRVFFPFGAVKIQIPRDIKAPLLIEASVF